MSVSPLASSVGLERVAVSMRTDMDRGGRDAGEGEKDVLIASTPNKRLLRLVFRPQVRVVERCRLLISR